MSSFETRLPVEIRDEIYSYLLLGNDVVPMFEKCYGRAQLVGLDQTFHTAIFRVNRKISAEAITYFYKRNAFVQVDFKNGSWRELLGLETMCTMKEVNESYSPPKSLVLLVKIGYSGVVKEYLRLIDSSYIISPSYIISARRFPLFIRLVNIITRDLAFSHHIYFASLTVTSTNKWESTSPLVRESIIGNLVLLRPALVLKQDLDKPTIQLHTDNSILPVDLNWEFHYLAKQAQEEFKENVRYVDRLFEQGDFHQAVEMCNVTWRESHYLRGELGLKDDSEYAQASFHLLLKACLMYTKLGRAQEALDYTEEIRTWFCRQDKRTLDRLNLDQRKVGDQLATVLTDSGRLGSIDEFCLNAKPDKFSIFDTYVDFERIRNTFWPNPTSNQTG